MAYILFNPMKRLVPVALGPFNGQVVGCEALTPLQWACYGAFVVFMAYVEGYKAFQLKFSPMVSDRETTRK